MRQITREAARAFEAAQPFQKDNTEIIVTPNVTIMKLFGNEIAYKYNDSERTLSITNRGHFTATTKERLNGITGVNIFQQDRKWFLNGKEWNGELINVKP